MPRMGSAARCTRTACRDITGITDETALARWLVDIGAQR
jgi:hypothetical protein